MNKCYAEIKRKQAGGSAFTVALHSLRNRVYICPIKNIKRMSFKGHRLGDPRDTWWIYNIPVEDLEFSRVVSADEVHEVQAKNEI